MFAQKTSKHLRPLWLLPGDAVVVAVVAGAAHQGAVLLVDEDGVDGAGGFAFVDNGVAHVVQAELGVERGVGAQQQFAGFAGVVAE